MAISEQELARLSNFPWLQQCGQEPPEFGFKVSVVATWSEAEASFSTPSWEDTTLEAHNDIMSRLRAVGADDATVWNTNAGRFREWIASNVQPRVEAVRQQESLSSCLIDCVGWDVLHGMMEMFFSKHRPPVFFRELLKVYEAGHLPVGWEGLRPDGHLIVF